jgi:hypothetical protein
LFLLTLQTFSFWFCILSSVRFSFVSF